MKDYINYCNEIYDFYNNLQKIFHTWWHKANIKDYELRMPEPIQTRELDDDLMKLKEKRNQIIFPESDDFFLKTSSKQIELILKSAAIQIEILSGKKYDPVVLRKRLYDIDINKWFKLANDELELSLERSFEVIGKEKTFKLISSSGGGTITGEEKINTYINNFIKNAVSKIDEFTYISKTEKSHLKKVVNYKIDYNLSDNLVMRIVPGEKKMYINPNYSFSNIFLDFILSHDFCGHGFHDALSNQILHRQRPNIFKTWYDDEFDVFSCFGEGMSCFAEKVVPSFLGLNNDVIDYVHVRQKIWLPLRVILDMKINIKKTPINEIKEEFKQFDFPDDFIDYNIKNILLYNTGYMSVYYPSLKKVEELQNKYNLNSFKLYELLLTAGNISIDSLEEYLNTKLLE